MSSLPNAVSTADARDQEAEDRDETALRRDQASASRDRAAQERDQRAEDLMRAALLYARLVSQMLEASRAPGAQLSIADQTAVLHNLVAKLTQTLQAAQADRQAALADRQSAANDRRLAGADRGVRTAHRQQAAIEGAQEAIPAPAEPGRAEELIAAARSACSQAETIRHHARAIRAIRLTPPDKKERLQKSLLARQAARLQTMPVIEQAKGILMAQRRCDADQAFDLLRQASQRLNEPVRDIAARIVASTATDPPDQTGHAQLAGR